jgi:thiamine-monophosphate kinase
MEQKSAKRTEISSLGEFGLIDRLTAGMEAKDPSTIKGIGDDAAVLDHSGKLTVVSTDLLLEGIHFDLMYQPLKHLGYKSVVTNLSDIYAMNAIPTQITVSLGLSNRFSVEAVEEIYEGVKAACSNYDVDLIGGDTTSSKQGLFLSVTAIGQVERDQVVYRDGAKKGDLICVTGDLGAAYLGLQLLEREKQLFISHPDVQPDLENQQYLIGRQLKPEARRDSIEYFKKAGVKPTAMIDISDGLASEMLHLCKASKVGAYIEENKVPIHPDTEQMAFKFRLDPITCALSGGEDYELLFTVDIKDLEKVRHMPSVYIIGEIVDASDGAKLHTSGGNIYDIKAQGWTHFSWETMFDVSPPLEQL